VFIPKIVKRVLSLLVAIPLLSMGGIQSPNVNQTFNYLGSPQIQNTYSLAGYNNSFWPLRKVKLSLRFHVYRQGSIENILSSDETVGTRHEGSIIVGIHSGSDELNLGEWELVTRQYISNVHAFDGILDGTGVSAYMYDKHHTVLLEFNINTNSLDIFDGVSIIYLKVFTDENVLISPNAQGQAVTALWYEGTLRYN
jgi:hypothetical protein